MDIFPIWKTSYYPTTESDAVFRIMKWGTQEIYRGRGRRYPDGNYLDINLNRSTQNTLDSMIWEALGASGDTVALSNGYAEFSLDFYDSSTDIWTTVYQFAMVNDWSYEEHEGNVYSEPINGHACPGMVLPYSYLVTGDTAETICYDEISFTMPYISILPQVVSIAKQGGTATITVTANCHWWIPEESQARYFSQAEGESGVTTVTITVPENESYHNMSLTVTFKARNDRGIATERMLIFQPGEDVYFEITSGNGKVFNTMGGTWNLEYETNLPVVYYEFSGGETGYTSGGTLSFILPAGDSNAKYSVAFYDSPGGFLLEHAYANRLKGLYDYFHFEFLENGSIIFARSLAQNKSIQYTRDSGLTWETATSSSRGYTITGNTGDIVYMKGTNSTYGEEGGGSQYFGGTTRCNVAGNIMSLVYGDDFTDKFEIENDWEFSGLFGGFSGLVSAADLILPASILKPYCYNGLFGGCTSLVNAPELISMYLEEGCYAGMFHGCTSLVNAPELPAENMAPWCYNDMFNGCTALENVVLPATKMATNCYASMFMGCTALETAPALPATEMEESCYSSMFYGCTGLTTAPALPATTLANACYSSMFYSCRSLVNAPALPATDLAVHCYSDMFNNCRNLVNAPALPATTLEETCYTGMFMSCVSLETAPVISATTLADSCCLSMFRGCSGLTSAPTLMATTLANACYSRMFEQCTSLVNAPALPATTLANACYSSMFDSCRSLVNAPELNARTLVTGCYDSMFRSCIKIDYIKCLGDPNNDSAGTYYWLYNVKSTGTFVKRSGTTWPTGGSGIPDNWTVLTA